MRSVGPQPTHPPPGSKKGAVALDKKLRAPPPISLCPRLIFLQKIVRAYAANGLLSELFGQKFKAGLIRGESKSYADHFEDLVREKAAHLKISVQEMERRRRDGDAELLSIMLGAPTIAAAYRYWDAEQTLLHPAQVAAPDLYLLSIERQQAGKPACVVDLLVTKVFGLMAAALLGHDKGVSGLFRARRAGVPVASAVLALGLEQALQEVAGE
jgi:hypothetical protein